MAKRGVRGEGRRLEVLPVASEAEARQARETALRLLAEWIRAEASRRCEPEASTEAEELPGPARGAGGQPRCPRQERRCDASGDLPARLHR